MEDLRQAVTGLALLLLILGPVLWMLPIATCTQCPHCTKERLEAAERHRLGSYCFTHRAVRRDCDHQHKEP